MWVCSMGDEGNRGNSFVYCKFQAPSAGFGPNYMVGLDGQGNKTSSEEATRGRKGFSVNRNM